MAGTTKTALAQSVMQIAAGNRGTELAEAAAKLAQAILGERKSLMPWSCLNCGGEVAEGGLPGDEPDHFDWCASAKPETDPDTVLSVTVTLKMTAKDRTEYAGDYGLLAGEVAGDVARNFQDGVQEALGDSNLPLLAEYATYSVSAAR